MAEQGKGTHRLVPSELPQRRSNSFYAEIIREFREGDTESVLVAETGRKPLTLWQGLRKTLQGEGIEDVRVVLTRLRARSQLLPGPAHVCLWSMAPQVSSGTA